ncbi:MAG TPA: hypothetical protein DCY35_10530, partial [Prolixibacteraceae bacterium]|nr:hypothetical protein [Prolixibacteraceae bacterium]
MKKRRKVPKITILVILTMFLTSFSQLSLSRNQTIDIVRGFPSGWSNDTSLSPATGIGELHNNSAQIAINGDNIHIVRNGAIGWNTEIYYARSTDCGKTWEKNGLVTPNDGVPCMFPKIITNNSTLHLVYENWGSGFREVVYRRSSDDGEHWSIEFPISPGDLHNSQNPSIACSGQNVHVVWEDYRSNSQYNIYYKRSV